MNLKNSKVEILFDNIYHSLVFHDFLKSHFPFFLRLSLKRNKKKRDAFICHVKEKEKIRVVFFFQSVAQWNYDSVYRLMEQNEKFDPVVVVAPFNVHVFYNKQDYLVEMEKSIDFVKRQNYKFLSAYDDKSGKMVDVKKVIDPDVVFFTHPYKNTYYKYHIYNFRDRLTCYVPYGFFISKKSYRNNAGLPFHSYLWKFFVESSFQKQESVRYAINKGENVVITGSLPMETMIDSTYVPKSVWKSQKTPKKKIIWAPHHTIDYLVNFSTFLIYADWMLELAEKYQNEIQFAFKPHPVLKQRLINCWGYKKTNEYYQKWAEMSNTQLEEGDYLDLFLTSDALIHDSISFILEYVYLPQKPVQYLIRDNQKMEESLNELGRAGLEVHYRALSKNDIEDFIRQVVLEEKDPMKATRQQFFNDYLAPKNALLPSKIIIDEILKDIES